MRGTQPNRLSGETSPYLRQHADNPVDWYPWGEEAIQRARTEDKPILLSIGYSACHWCHVMAHESFEDPATAALMNELFVNVKVDREERPDLDKIYQLVHQVMTRRAGGWPLTVFLDPKSHLPIFAGTYFPKSPRYQMPAFTTVLRRVAEYYRAQRAELQEQGRAVAAILRSAEGAEPESALNRSLLAHAQSELSSEFDEINGGFGAAPKFPQVGNLEFLLDAWRRSGGADRQALRMVEFSLRKMAEGGLRDQLGGGFYRYSVDAEWQIPHFEKMLYDNAELLRLYAIAYSVTSEPLFRLVVETTAGWVFREMSAPDGGFYAALDADSECEEGKFYVWEPREVEALLEPLEFAVVTRHYGLDQTPNFEGRWHLQVQVPLATVAAGLGLTPDAAQRILDSARAKLFAARAGRVRPGLDDKRLTSWNALMIRGLAVAGRLLRRPDWIAAAADAFAWLQRTVGSADGRVRATYKEGQARFGGYLDDHAFLLAAGLELLECRWDAALLESLMTLAERLLEHFEDPRQGGFFFTASDHEPLIHRPKSFADESHPAGNGVAALALLRLGHLVGEQRYLDAAERTLEAAAGVLRKYPHGHGTLLLALAEYLQPAELLIIRGRAEALPQWSETARRQRADWHVYAIPDSVAELPGVLARPSTEAGEIAYLCGPGGCRAPIRSLAELEALAGGATSKPLS